MRQIQNFYYKPTTQEHKKWQLGVINKVFQNKYEIPECIIFQISRFIFGNPFQLNKNLFLRIEKPLLLAQCDSKDFYILKNHLTKFQITVRWKPIISLQFGINRMMELSQDFLYILRCQSSSYKICSNSQRKTKKMFDHIICSQNNKEHLQQIFWYSQNKRINEKVTSAFCDLLRKEIIFFKVEQETGIYIPNLEENGQDIQNLLSSIVFGEGNIDDSPLKIYQKIDKIYKRGIQKLLIGKEQATLFDCYIQDSQ